MRARALSLSLSLSLSITHTHTHTHTQEADWEEGIERLLEEREEARSRRAWPQADALRALLTTAGVAVDDDAREWWRTNKKESAGPGAAARAGAAAGAAAAGGWGEGEGLAQLTKTPTDNVTVSEALVMVAPMAALESCRYKVYRIDVSVSA